MDVLSPVQRGRSATWVERGRSATWAVCDLFSVVAQLLRILNAISFTTTWSSVDEKNIQKWAEVDR